MGSNWRIFVYFVHLWLMLWQEMSFGLQYCVLQCQIVLSVSYKTCLLFCNTGTKFHNVKLLFLPVARNILCLTILCFMSNCSVIYCTEPPWYLNFQALICDTNVFRTNGFCYRSYNCCVWNLPEGRLLCFQFYLPSHFKPKINNVNGSESVSVSSLK